MMTCLLERCPDPVPGTKRGRPQLFCCDAHRKAQKRRVVPYQHILAPEVQTTGDTTPVQQIVYVESLTTSGGSNA